MTNALAYSIRLSIMTQKIYNAASWIGVKINNLCCRPKKVVTNVRRKRAGKPITELWSVL